MSGNDTDHFPVKTGKFAFPYPESNVYQGQTATSGVHPHSK